MLHLKFRTVTVLISLMVIAFLGTLTASADGPGEAPGGKRAHSPQAVSSQSLSQVVSEFGRITLSLDALGTMSTSGTIHVEKPNGGKVRKAYLMSATTGWSNARLNTGDVQLQGSSVVWNKEISNSIYSYNYWADVTSIIKATLDAAPGGIVGLTITEANSAAVDGEILAVIFDDPSQTTDNTVMLYFGAQNISGDTFNINLGSPINKSDSNLILNFSLGISYGYQGNGAQQYSIVNVNDKRLTTSAGGEDDGEPSNGALITVGGIGDSNDNPPDPYATPTNARSDDELYDLKPFVNNGDTSIKIDTSNPSQDDNILFAALSLGATRSVNTTDMNISLYDNPTTDQDRAPYENIIRYFADGVYESSNGANRLGTVTFHTSNADSDEANVIWVEKCHPNSNVAGYGINGMHVNMCDIFTKGNSDGSDYNFLSDDSHQKGGGYALAHEWGHYYYSLYDEYVGDKSYDNQFAMPHTTDKAVKNSIMNYQWNALPSLFNLWQGDFNWLNFSVAKNDCTKTAQYRVYQACGWDTLVRPVAQDPRDGERVSLPARLYHGELKDVAPAAGQDAKLDLPDDARKGLNIIWESPPIASPLRAQQANALPYTAQLSSILGQNISYPNPILLLAFVNKDLTITDAGVQASVQLPDGTIQSVSFADDGVPPDAVKGDGLYSAIIGYGTNGVYTVNVTFDNNAGTAKFVATAFQPSLGVDGQPIPLPDPVLVGENFSVSKMLQVSVSNVVADDYGNTPAASKAVTADNVPIPGKIDYAGDKDVLQFTTLNSGVTFVRVANLALGMKPHLQVLGSDATTVLFETSQLPSSSTYLYIPLRGVPPGTTVYVLVSDDSSSASGGLYEFSAGSKLAGETATSTIYLPYVTR